MKNIIFDLGGVVLDLDYDRCIRSFEQIGFKGAENYVSCYHPMEIFGALERGEIAPSAFCEELRKMSGCEMSDEQISRAYQSILVSIPVGKLRLMQRLRAEGYKVYALSNMSKIMLSRVAELFECDGQTMESYFDDMFISYQMGVMKPDPKIYEMLLEKTGAKASESLFIDDGEKNIVAARAMGFNVYLAKERESFDHLFE